MRKIIFIVLSLLMASAVVYAAIFALSDTLHVQLGKYTFNIPKQYSQEGALPHWLIITPGLDDGSKDYLLRFPAKEIVAAIPGYKEMDGRYTEDITAILAVLTSVEVKRYEDSERYRDLWNATGSYLERIVELYTHKPWFKIYRKIEYPNSWAVVSQSPENGALLPKDTLDFWVAHCLSGNSPLTKSGEIAICDSYVFYEDIVIDFSVSEQNLDVINDVRSYLKNTIENWRVAE